jgi:hypothetical protein
VKKVWPSKAVWRGVVLGGVIAGVRRQLLMTGVVVAVAALAFWWGRGFAPAQSPPGTGLPALSQTIDPGAMAPLAPASHTDYSRRVVAYIYGTTPITREDLGEYLIARFGAERLEFLVNRRIIERVCQVKGIEVTELEIDADLGDTLKGLNINRQDFVSKVLKNYNKTLYEWREDVIRPKLALNKLCRDQVKVSEDEVKQAFEAHYGEKVECRMILLLKEDAHRKWGLWEKVSKDDKEFDSAARTQALAPLAAKGGEIPPIHKNFADVTIEREAFSLKPGEVSKLLEMPDGTSVILKCVRHIPADTTKKLADERVNLYKEVFDLKLQQVIPKMFQQLKQEANAKLFLKKNTMEEVERQVRQEIQPPPPQLQAPPAAKSGLTPPRGN